MKNQKSQKECKKSISFNSQLSLLSSDPNPDRMKKDTFGPLRSMLIQS